MSNSILKHIDPKSILAEVRMQRQLHKGAFVLIEGQKDLNRFRGVLAEKGVAFVICNGKTNAIGAMELIEEEGWSRAIAFVERDFEDGTEPHFQNENIIRSSYYDFDMEVIYSRALSRYLCEVAPAGNFSTETNCQQLRTEIVNALAPLTIIRKKNVKEKLFLNLKNVDVDSVINGDAVSIEILIEKIGGHRLDRENASEKIKDDLYARIRGGADLHKFTSGHDFCDMLGVWLRSKIARRHREQTRKEEVEIHLRLTYSGTDFATSDCYSKVREWEKKNGFPLIYTS